MKLHLECSQTVVTIDLVTRWRKQRRLDKTDFKSAVSTNFTIGAPAARQASGQRNRSSTSTQATDTFTTSQPLLPRKKGSLSFPFNFGAGNRSRTDDLNLGKVALYQLSYSRKLSTHAIQRIRFKQSCILLLISAVMQTNTETRTRQTKPKLAATTPSHHITSHHMHCTLMNWRRGPESNRPQRICNPTHNRFATAPNLTSWQKKGEVKASPFCRKVEREIGLEPTTSTLARLRSTN